MAFDNEYNNRLQELSGSDFEIVDGEPDIRGWSVKTPQGESLGDVDELIFDVESRKVRYIVLDLDDNEWDLDSKSVLVPIGIAELDEDDDDVILPNVTAEQLKALPEYDDEDLTPDTELQIRNIFRGLGAAAPYGADFYSHDHFNERNLYRNRSRRNEGRQTVIGIFESPAQAQNAIQRLRTTGIADTDIDIADRTANAGDYNDDSDSGVSNFFSNLFGNDDDARTYSKAAKNSTVVTVHARSSEEAQRAAEILDENGAVDVNELTGRHGNSGNETGEISIPIIEEELRVGKREVETGGARLKSRIVERPVEEGIRLRTERVTVERNPVNRPATESDLSGLRDETIELTEKTEVPIVNKEARVVEEVSLNKEVDETEETVRDTVRKTDVDIERLDSDEDPRDSDWDNKRNRDI